MWQIYQINTCIGHVVAVEEFSFRRASAPDGHGGLVVDLGFVKFSDQRRDDMRVVEVIVVAKAI